MEFILDNKETEETFQRLLKIIKLRQSGEVSDLMKQQGIEYKLNWGVAIPDLREIARGCAPNHLLALKLWNKQWRETMILATLLDEPEKVTEEQMDFWTKSFENTEIAEQTSANLWVRSKYAYAKALEWCRGKKHLVRFTGIHLMGRLAIADKKAIDEMFEPFFDELTTLAKDEKLFTPIYRAVIAMGTRSKGLNSQCIVLSKKFQSEDAGSAIQLGKQLFNELICETIQDILEEGE